MAYPWIDRFWRCDAGLARVQLTRPSVFLIQGDKQLLREFLIAYGYLASHTLIIRETLIDNSIKN